MKIGTRLTIWGTFITLATCAIVCITLYLGLSASLHKEVDSFLLGEVQEFLEILREEGGESFDVVERDIRRELGSRVRNDLTFRLLNVQGGLILTSHEHAGLPNPWRIEGAQDAEQKPWFETVDSGKGSAETRACSLRVNLPTKGEFIVQATYSLAGVNRELMRFRNLEVIVLAIAAIASVFGGRVLARKSLRPIHAMTETARHFGASDLSQRLNHACEGDELDELAIVLNDMLQRLEQQVLRIRQFTADAAHELRTPLAALRGNAEVALSEAATPESRRQVLEESIAEYDRLARLTDDLLLLARADADQAFFKRAPVALDAAIADVAGLFGAIAEDKQIDLTSQSTKPVVIQGDAERIRQVLCNLLDNALKHTPTGGRIELSLHADQHTARLVVADTGVGIDPGALPHVFERFYRVDVARTRSSGGFGLGLPICRAIITAHGGTITINSRNGVGTEVEILLPNVQ